MLDGSCRCRVSVCVNWCVVLGLKWKNSRGLTSLSLTSWKLVLALIRLMCVQSMLWMLRLGSVVRVRRVIVAVLVGGLVCLIALFSPLRMWNLFVVGCPRIVRSQVLLKNTSDYLLVSVILGMKGRMRHLWPLGNLVSVVLRLVVLVCSPSAR